MVIQTTIHDVVFSGHGGIYAPPIQATRVPPGVEFWMLAPPGAFVMNHVGWMLEQGQRIEGLFLRGGLRGHIRTIEPTIYPHGAELPDFVLMRGDFIQKDKKTVPHIISVVEETHLQDLWKYIDPFRTVSLKTGKILRVFWGACSDIDDQNVINDVGALNHFSAELFIRE